MPPILTGDHPLPENGVINAPVRTIVKWQSLYRGSDDGDMLLDKLANIPPWILHDLRRTFRTNLGWLKVRPDIAERLVNHISARTEMEETYDLYTYLPEMREAMEKWETFLKDVVAEPAVKRQAA